jgi:MGT family glycosyltransferase
MFTFPGHGHVNPMLRLAAELARRRHLVSVVAAERFAGLVRRPAEPVIYRSAFPAHAPEVETAGDAVTMIIELMREGFAPLPAALEAFAARHPDVFIYDTIAPNSARVLARAWDRPLIQAFPVFAMNDDKEIPGAPAPPADHPAAAGFDPADPRLTSFAAEFGAGITELLTRYDLTPELAESSLAGGDDDLHLVFLPRSFQFGGETFGDRYRFVGPMSPDQDRAGAAWQPPANGLPVVLVSLGTVANDDTAVFLTCVSAFAGQPWHVVLALGPDVEPASLGSLPPNVEARAWVDYPSVLAHASVIISAAGMGSIMMALRHEVPIVACPRRQEQAANACRVAQLGLGRDLGRDVTQQSIMDAVRAVTADRRVAASLAAMHRDIESAGGEVRAADEVEALMAGADAPAGGR